MATNQNVVFFNFRGKNITVTRNVLAKFPKHSEFTQYVYNTCNQDLQSLISTQSKENTVDRPACIFIERNPALFDNILDYIHDGELHFPHTVCVSLVQKELNFWGYSESDLAPCCHERVLKEEVSRKEYEEFKKKWSLVQRPQNNGKGGNVVYRNVPDGGNMTAEAIEVVDDVPERTQSPTKGWSCSDVFLDPASCILAKIYAGFIIAIIIASLVAMSLATAPQFKHYRIVNGTDSGIEEIDDVILFQWQWIPEICTFILILDFIFRFALCSSGRCRFLIQPISILDLLGILPGLIYIVIALFAPTFPLLRIIRLLRLFRVSRAIYLLSTMRNIRALILTVRYSLTELLFLLFLYGIFSNVFGILMYYAESGSDESHFKSAFGGQWWAVITLTTVGYGDTRPLGLGGRIIASLCAFAGILLIALEISVLVKKFLSVTSHIEKLERQRCKVVKAKYV